MTARHGKFGEERIFGAVVRRFPGAEFAIRRCAGRDETFRDLCEELAAAEAALNNVGGLALEIQESRRAEWQEQVDRLADEVADVLHHRLGIDFSDRHQDRSPG